jgi:hypothetical protein
MHRDLHQPRKSPSTQLLASQPIRSRWALHPTGLAGRQALQLLPQPQTSLSSQYPESHLIKSRWELHPTGLAGRQKNQSLLPPLPLLSNLRQASLRPRRSLDTLSILLGIRGYRNQSRRSHRQRKHRQHPSRHPRQARPLNQHPNQVLLQRQLYHNRVMISALGNHLATLAGIGTKRSESWMRMLPHLSLPKSPSQHRTQSQAPRNHSRARRKVHPLRLQS